MFDYLKDIKDQEETIKKIEADFEELFKAIENKTWIEKIPFMDFLGKASYYKTLFRIYKMSKDENTFNTIVAALKTDKIELEKHFSTTKEKVDELKMLKNNKNVFISKQNEIIIFTKSEMFWYYIIINTLDNLRVFNLTSIANGYHIFGTGRFCAGTTYRDLKVILEEGEIVKFILLLKKVLTDYDDGEQHAWTAKDFDHWRELQKEIEKGFLTEQTRSRELAIIAKKLKFIESDILEPLSEETQEFILDKIDSFENYIRSHRFEKDTETLEEKN